jgi:hypothetical protein
LELHRQGYLPPIVLLITIRSGRKKMSEAEVAMVTAAPCSTYRVSRLYLEAIMAPS